MANNYLLATSGAQDWTDTSIWSLGAAPVSTDNVFILQGNADIQTGLAQSAVILASLTIAGSFSGTIASTAGAPLQIGVATGGPVSVNCTSPLIVLDFGSTQPKVIPIQTGQPLDSTFGSEAFRFRGGGAATALYMNGSNTSVGVATDVPGLTATLASWNVAGGTLNMAIGVTWTNGYQSGGIASVNSAGTLIQQSGPTPALFTGGTGKINTINVTGGAVIGNRPAAGTDAYATLSIGPNATADHSQDPRGMTITNAIIMALGSTLITFTPEQVQMAGSTPLQVKTQQCGIQDVVINLGTPVLATLTSY